MADEKRKRQELPLSYYLEQSDPDILILRRDDDTFVAAFSARGATRKGIAEAAREDYKSLLERTPEGDDEGHEPSDA